MKVFFFLALTLVLFSCQRDVSKKEDLNTEVESAKSESPETKSGIVYFSFDDADSWQNQSKGLPPNITLTDLATSNDNIFASTKQNGIFIYDFRTSRWNNTLAKPETLRDVEVLATHRGEIVIGTGGDGIFVSNNNGKTWSANNKGLENLTIRRIVVIDDKIFIGTNGGLYSRSQNADKWEFEFGHPSLQVNGITKFDGDMYIGTTEGVYKSNKQNKDWKQVMSEGALHNISSDTKNVYALVYSELFSSADKGETWINIQNGLPKNLYSFQLREKGENIFIGQWDGVYKRKREGTNNWILTNKGMPEKFPTTDIIVFNDILVASSSGWVVTNH